MNLEVIGKLKLPFELIVWKTIRQVHWRVDMWGISVPGFLGAFLGLVYRNLVTFGKAC